MIFIHNTEEDGEGSKDSNDRKNDSEKDKNEKEILGTTKDDNGSSPQKKTPGKNGQNGHNRSYCIDPRHPHNSSCHSLSSIGIQQGFHFNRLSSEMRVFVASDTLNSLLVASSSNITAETLILVRLSLFLNCFFE